MRQASDEAEWRRRRRKRGGDERGGSSKVEDHCCAGWPFIGECEKVARMLSNGRRGDYCRACDEARELHERKRKQ